MQNRKELINSYKNRKQVGGICTITNTKTNKVYIFSSPDIDGSKNRFEFSKKNNSCVNIKLQDDWNKYGADSFTFEVVEKLEKGDEQTAKDFSDDLNVLLEMYTSKVENVEKY